MRKSTSWVFPERPDAFWQAQDMTGAAHDMPPDFGRQALHLQAMQHWYATG